MANVSSQASVPSVSRRTWVIFPVCPRGNSGRAGEGRKNGHGWRGWRGWHLAVEGPLWTSLVGARFDRRARAKSRVVQQGGPAGKGIGCLRRTCSLGTIAPATPHGRIRARHQSEVRSERHTSAGLGAAGSERLSTSGLAESQCVWGGLARDLIV
ncbi:predicted protein [Histoplasma capsulatum G186AR]|uniref:Uncharacterized protein n=1 Tax=Ajellomyces capsulatus (strain G186AR / H82 / ATCC MYA-2454 / RMSCC 2432) TaxID=447093 RepID=C0NXF1_AJECG|nr:uncharacterized protein HCBG_08143 [Histoplasma capsulatum G186AR]EEH04017.1 predicted protein [Histoplasma capsulatum G186AR]